MGTDEPGMETLRSLTLTSLAFAAWIQETFGEPQVLVPPKNLVSELRADRDSLASKLATATEALRWYADEENYDEGSSFLRGMSKVQGDKGWRADDALKKIDPTPSAAKEGGDEWDGTFRDGCDETKDHR